MGTLTYFSGMKPDYFSIRSQALPHVKQFLQNRYGSPIVLDEDSIFYDYLKEIVRRRPDKDLAEHNPLTLSRYTEEMEFYVPKSFYSHYGLFLTKTNTIKFNRFCSEYIKDVARMELYSAFITTGKKEAGYETAMFKLELSADVFPFDAVKKDFQRLKQKKPGLFSKKMIQSLSPILSREKK